MKYQVLIAAVVTAWMSSSLLAEQVTFQAVEDAYVDSIQTSSTFNSHILQNQGFGDDPYPDSDVASAQRSFLKFEVSSLEGKTILSAEFGIYLNAFSEYSTPSMQLSHISDDTWSQNSITWNNSQSLAAGASAIGTDEMADTLRYYVWNVFPDWVDGDITDGHVSYMLTVGREEFNNYAYFNSSENSANQPFLRIEFIPEPSTFCLLALGTLAIRKRMLTQ